MSPSRRNKASDSASRSPPDGELTEAELDEQIVDLPAREALSIVDPSGLGIGMPIPFGKPPESVPATPTDAEPIEPTT